MEVVGPGHPIEMGGLVEGGASTTQQGDAGGGAGSASSDSASRTMERVRLPSLPDSSPYQTSQGSTGPAEGSARDALVDRLGDFDGEEAVVLEGNSTKNAR